MPVWEYKVITFRVGEAALTGAREQLDQAGLDDWELCGVGVDQKNDHILYMKRPLAPSPQPAKQGR